MSTTSLDKALRGLMASAGILTGAEKVDQRLRLEIPRPYCSEMQAMIVVLAYPHKLFVSHDLDFCKNETKEFKSGLEAQKYIYDILRKDKSAKSIEFAMSTDTDLKALIERIKRELTAREYEND